ncbi:cytochrome o ubiquinol oxidase subunit IV [Aureimonas mangrovi]|uniref:cytochrome o ubiquinol oxidase subunit IV n=1 Tax=Aureimonas mangrovi TaxID=2758041 RepID=UPI00163D61DC|nr:cytochrome o ubiquinol oxidase subunit IV [Aureimonas mangrovi]
MSANAQTANAQIARGGHHAHDADHGHGHDSGHAHGTRKTYLIGFALSVVLTAIPFWLVMAEVISNPVTTTFLIMACGLAQILVHMIYFLHMNAKSEGGWTLMAAIFTIIVTLIALVGSLWVMYHLNTNMMPGHTMEATDTPEVP